MVRCANRTPPAGLILAIALALVPAASCGTGAAEGGQYAEIRGLRMYYESHGSGPPLLLIHGGAGNGMQFEHQVPAFALTHRLIVPDCRAQGRTTDRPGPLSYHEMAEDMIALLARHVGLQVRGSRAGYAQTTRREC